LKTIKEKIPGNPGRALRVQLLLSIFALNVEGEKRGSSRRKSREKRLVRGGFRMRAKEKPHLPRP